jgi:hypothetical protein
VIRLIDCRKSDMADAERLAGVVAHGMVRQSRAALGGHAERSSGFFDGASETACAINVP